MFGLKFHWGLPNYPATLRFLQGSIGSATDGDLQWHSDIYQCKAISRMNGISYKDKWFVGTISVARSFEDRVQRLSPKGPRP